MNNDLQIDKKTMRDVFIARLYDRMRDDRSLFFLTADFGSPQLDRIRADFSDRFINVGIAEQNLVNVAAGLALEGFTVYAYAIAPFLTMRAYEQIRNNLSILSHTHPINVNLIGVGCGLSYEVSGPTHHSLEDLSIIRTLPNIALLSPSDWALAEQFVDYTITHRTPKYIRFDGKPLPNLHNPASMLDIEKGFIPLATGDDICIISTGYMTRTALRAVELLTEQGIHVGLIDLFLLKPLPEQPFLGAISRYRRLITIEEGFKGKGGLDALVSSLLCAHNSDIRMVSMGFSDAYVFAIDGRDALHALNGIGASDIVDLIKRLSPESA